MLKSSRKSLLTDVTEIYSGCKLSATINMVVIDQGLIHMTEAHVARTNPVREN